MEYYHTLNLPKFIYSKTLVTDHTVLESFTMVDNNNKDILPYTENENHMNGRSPFCV